MCGHTADQGPHRLIKAPRERWGLVWRPCASWSRPGAWFVLKPGAVSCLLRKVLSPNPQDEL